MERTTIKPVLKPFEADSPMYDQTVRLYQTAFPDCERKPLSMILEGIAKGKMEGFIIETGGGFSGLAFFILGQQYDILDYLAIDPSRRGQSIGTAVLSLLKQQRRRGFIVEIESTLTSGDSEAHRRKSFYLSNGMQDIHVPIELFGVDMELLCSEGMPGFEDYYREMKAYFGEMADRHIRQGNFSRQTNQKSD